MTKNLIIVGTGGHARSIFSIAKSNGYFVIGFIDDKNVGGEFCGKPILTKKQSFASYPDENYFIAVGDNFTREKIYLEFNLQQKNIKFPTLIHNMSTIGVDSEIGIGSIIMPFVNIGPNSKVGNFCILNTSSSIDHDCQMMNFSSIAPGVISGGNVVIGLRSILSIGAVVEHKISIGNDVLIGANSFVNKSVQNNQVLYGTPSKFIRMRNKNDPYL